METKHDKFLHICGPWLISDYHSVPVTSRISSPPKIKLLDVFLCSGSCVCGLVCSGFKAIGSTYSNLIRATDPLQN